MYYFIATTEAGEAIHCASFQDDLQESQAQRHVRRTFQEYNSVNMIYVTHSPVEVTSIEAAFKTTPFARIKRLEDFTNGDRKISFAVQYAKEARRRFLGERFDN